MSHDTAAPHSPLTITFYVKLYIGLLVLLLATVGASYLHLGPFNFAVAFTIAVIKALLVILYFMHVRFTEKLIWLTAGAGFLWLAYFLGLLFNDYLFRW